MREAKKYLVVNSDFVIASHTRSGVALIKS
jgi:hypothetical protein